MNARPDAGAGLAGRSEAAKAPTRAKPATAALPPTLDSEIFREVRAQISVRLGDLTLTVEELLALENGSVLTLDRMLNELVDLHLNDTLIARGEIVAVDDHFGVRIVEVRPEK